MKTKNYLKSIVGILTICSLSVQAQNLSFTNANSKLPNNAANYRSGCAVSVADVNNDGLDDLVRLNNSTDLHIDIQQRDGSFIGYSLGTFTGGKAWAMTVADFNNDGIKDVVAGMGSTGSVAIINYDGSTYTANISVLGGGNFFWQNITVGDFNNDGWLDIFGCDDVNYSKIFMNNGNGTFRRIANANQSLTIGTGIITLNIQSGLNFTNGQSVYVGYNGENYMTGEVVSYSGSTLEVNVTSTQGSGTYGGWSVDKDIVFNTITHPGNWPGTSDPNNSGNYGTVWTDFDGDGDLDLYIAKCRQSSQNVNDLRRIDQVFVNDGTNKFKEDAGPRGIANGWQTWTASFGDIDNDGDFDMVAINNDHSSQIFENDGTGNFIELTASNVSTTGIYPIESLFEDFDNDGYIDLLISGSSDYIYYKNNGDKTFTRINNLMSNNGVLSFATGDLNHDGFIDIYASFGSLYNNPSASDDDVMYLNNGNDVNHFITFDLQGTVSSRDAIGANVYIYGPWGVQRREVRSGESYGTCNSSMLHFGLGFNQQVDSAKIIWPSGIVQHLYNLAANQFVTVIENTCAITGNIISGTQAICNGQSTTLYAAQGYASYLWSDNSTGDNLTTSVAGSFSVLVTDNNGCSNLSPVVTVQENPIETPIIMVAGETSFCQGNNITLTASPGSSYIWSNGDTTQSISIGLSGNYFVQVMGACQYNSSDAVNINVYPALAPTATGGNVSNQGTITLSATGNNLTWYEDSLGTVAVGNGSTFTTPVLTTSTYYYVQDTYTYGGGNESVGPVRFTGNSSYSSNSVNASLIFDAYDDFVLKTVKVYTDTPGDRLITLTDDDDNVIQSIMVNIPVDSAVITLNFNVPAGNNYKLGTDAAQNQILHNNNGPRLKRSQGSTVTYPYSVNNLVSINNSTQGLNVYYYFYDWQIEKQSTVCLSPMVPVLAEVIVTNVNNYLNHNDFISLYPNPANDYINLSSAQSIQGNFSVDITDVIGQTVERLSYNSLSSGEQKQIYVGSLAKGIYLIKVNIEGTEHIKKIILK